MTLRPLSRSSSMISPLPDHPEVAAAAAAMATEERVADAEVGGKRKRKKTLGRQKIEIKRIECPVARHVCFSKRRNGLFKKATELCVLTGAHLAIVVSSPAGKPFPFGHPSVDAVLDGYLHPGSYAVPTGEPTFSAIVYGYDGECERLQKATAAERRRGRALDAAARAAGAWTGDDVRRAEMRDLAAMLAALERVQAEVREREMMHQQLAAAAAARDAFQFQLYPGAATFTADGGGGAGNSSSSSHQEAMDTNTMMMLMGGNVSHALPSAPMMLPADLPRQPPVPQAFNYGFADHYHFAAGYAAYGYDLGDGSGHGTGYDMEGYCYGTTATTCNFFE